MALRDESHSSIHRLPKVSANFTVSTANRERTLIGARAATTRSTNSRRLTRVSARFSSVMLNEVTKAFFTRTAAIERPRWAPRAGIVANPNDAAARDSRDPRYRSMLRTCVATMLTGGHARNALPRRRARTSIVAWRRPRPADVRASLMKAVADTGVSLAKPSDGTRRAVGVVARGDGSIEKVTRDVFGGASRSSQPWVRGDGQQIPSRSWHSRMACQACSAARTTVCARQDERVLIKSYYEPGIPLSPREEMSSGKVIREASAARRRAMCDSDHRRVCARSLFAAEPSNADEWRDSARHKVGYVTISSSPAALSGFRRDRPGDPVFLPVRKNTAHSFDNFAPSPRIGFISLR